MTTLEKNALGRDVISPKAVEKLYAIPVHPAADTHRAVRNLCESHERLRMELEGSATLHEESAKGLRDAAGDLSRMRGQVEHAVDAGLTHAAEIARLREGLLRIFARAPDWSGECVQANVADLLGMKVAAVRAEIDAEGGAP